VSNVTKTHKIISGIQNGKLMEREVAVRLRKRIVCFVINHKMPFLYRYLYCVKANKTVTVLRNYKKVKRGQNIAPFYIFYSFVIRQTECAEIPSFSPVNPRPSSVVALTLTHETSTEYTCAIFFCICSI